VENKLNEIKFVRFIDDQPPDPAFPHIGQLGGDDLDMPVHRELSLRVEVMETTRGEGAEVLPQQRVVLGSGQVLDHRAFGFERWSRAFSCSMTFSSDQCTDAEQCCEAYRRKREKQKV
jgi:hypothetical protein